MEDIGYEKYFCLFHIPIKMFFTFQRKKYQIPCRPKYELRLVASDNLNENYTTIVIHVNDVNDNPPVFDRPTYETQITEEDDRNLPKRVLQVPKKYFF